MSSSDDCVIEGHCVSTNGYSSGSNYENGAACTVSILRGDKLSAEGFHTEQGYDFVTLHDSFFHGESGPQSVPVLPGDEMTWSSDLKGNELGWRICGRNVGPHNCGAEELKNFPEEKCTEDLHTGAFELSFSE